MSELQDTPVRDALLPPGDQADGEVLQDQGGAGQDPQDGVWSGIRLGEMGQEDESDRVKSLDSFVIIKRKKTHSNYIEENLLNILVCLHYTIFYN